MGALTPAHWAVVLIVLALIAVVVIGVLYAIAAAIRSNRRASAPAGDGGVPPTRPAP